MQQTTKKQLLKQKNKEIIIILNSCQRIHKILLCDFKRVPISEGSLLLGFFRTILLRPKLG
jgi:hypothetical protein